ncbi:sugar ABC transporter substrate-binding protein [Nostoc sp. 3335mG]|nr:sugar ABC transporter substrate-binding protein [Nostoc sp. 3335mG]
MMGKDKGMKAFVSLAIAIAMPCAIALPAAAQSTWEGYQLGPEDQIEVSIYGQGGAVVKTRIKSDGSITLPLIGRVEAANRTTQALASSIQEQLKRGGYVNNPIVNVEIVDYASRAITVLGEFERPGLLPLDRPTTLSAMVARAGGVKATGGDLIELRRGGKVETYNLTRVARGQQPDVVLQPGDSVYAMPAPRYYAYGQIGSAGMFRIEPGMTIRQALARAGGPTLSGSERKVTLYRGGRELEAELAAPVLPDDVLFVRERIF